MKTRKPTPKELREKARKARKRASLRRKRIKAKVIRCEAEARDKLIDGDFLSEVSGPCDTYIERNRNLRQLGYRSYAAYLRGASYRKIRERAFIENGNLCWCCGDDATEIHHTDYGLATLLGQRLDNLVPICHRHHKEIEFENGEKVSTARANERLLELTGGRLPGNAEDF